MSKKIKLNDKIIKDHISDWSYETKDKSGNKIIKQKGNRSYTPFDVEKTLVTLVPLVKPFVISRTHRGRCPL